MPFGVGEVINALGLNPNIADPITRGVINVATQVNNAGGSLQDGIAAAQQWLNSQGVSNPSTNSSGGGSSPNIIEDSQPGASISLSGDLGTGTILSGGTAGTATPTANTSQAQNAYNQLIAYGYQPADARTLLESANSGNANSLKLLASMGIEPYYTYVTGGVSAGGASGGGGSSGGGGGGGGSTWTPLDDAQLAGVNLQNRQIGALFDPNYADGALVPLPDGTQRINGTEIIIDPREKGQYKPVANAPGYLVDPITGNVIDTNGNIIARDQLNETIRSNRVAEQQNASRIANDIYGTDLQAELGRGRLALDTVTDIGGLNLDAAKTENAQKLQNILETEGLNLQSFLGTGNLNIGATNAETNRINALSQRSQAGGNLALGNQQLQDARVQAIIALMANPQDFVQREYASRALNAPAGYTGPAFRDDPSVQQAINQLLAGGNDISNVDSLLPTYTAPTYNPVVLPNPTLPRVTAPAPQPQAQRQTPAQVAAISTPASDINGTPYSNTNVAPANQAASDHFRQAGVPDWALQPLGYAEGTPGTREQQFITGDPQADGNPNPELNTVHNPGPNTTVEVTPLRDMASGALQPDQIMTGKEMAQQGSQSQSSLGKLLADILIEISNQWGPEGGTAQYAYGTDSYPIQDRVQQYAQNENNPSPVRSAMQGAGNALGSLYSRLEGTPTPPANGNTNMQTGGYQQTNNQSNVGNVNNGMPFSPFNINHPFNLQNFYNQMRERYAQRFGSMPHALPMFAYGTDKPTEKKSTLPRLPEDWASFITDLIDNMKVGQYARSNESALRSRQRGADGISFNPKAELDASQVEDRRFTGVKPFSLGNLLDQIFIDNYTRFPVPGYAYGTDYGAIPGNANLNAQGGYAGPRDSQGRPLGSITTYDDSAIRNLPGVQYALGNTSRPSYNTLNTGQITGAFGTILPDVGGLNYGQLLDIQQDPDSWGVLSSLYRSGNRDLQGIFNRVQARAPIGNVTDRSLIRTG